LIVINENWNNNYVTHEWIRIFLHGGALNSKKTIYIINNAFGLDDKRWLHNTEGDAPIYPTNDTTTFRYLGLNLNMNLNWDDEIKRINQSVQVFCSKLLNSRVSTLKGIELLKTIFLSKIDISLTHATIPEKMLKKWNRKIIRTLFQLDGWSSTLTNKLSGHCFIELTKCNLLIERYNNNHLKEFIIILTIFHV